MNIQVLRTAIEDLAAARRFYDRQAPGVGDYFFDSLFTEIDSLALCAGIHAVHFGFYRYGKARVPLTDLLGWFIDMVGVPDLRAKTQEREGNPYLLCSR